MWKSIIEDTVLVNPEENSLSFFKNEDSSNGPSINTLSEPEIVRMIIKKDSWRRLFCYELRIPYKSILLGNVSRKEFLNRNESGDFDLLSIEKSNKEKVSIVEFKKVKVTSLGSEEDKINRLKDINTLIGQAEERVKIGFHKVSMCLIIQADLRNRKSQNILAKDITQSTADIIYKEMRRAREIDERIGIIYTKFYQPTGKDFKLSKNFSVHIDRYPVEQDQKTIITRGTRRMFKKIAR